MSGNSGPVVVNIEYDVPLEQAADFLAMIRQLGRIRRRNGATRWSVQQDVDHPESWLEHIHCATWVDHLRRLERYTVADRALAEKVAAFRVQLGGRCADLSSDRRDLHPRVNLLLEGR